MSNGFFIELDRLQDGKRQEIREDFEASFLCTQGEELQFPLPVSVEGEAYLAESELVVHLSAKTQALMPCAICNEMWGVELKIAHFYHTQPMNELKEDLFDLRVPLREALLIELPQTVECHGGQCPERPRIASYLRSGKKEKETPHFPFAGLE